MATLSGYLCPIVTKVTKITTTTTASIAWREHKIDNRFSRVWWYYAVVVSKVLWVMCRVIPPIRGASI